MYNKIIGWSQYLSESFQQILRGLDYFDKIQIVFNGNLINHKHDMYYTKKFKEWYCINILYYAPRIFQGCIKVDSRILLEYLRDILSVFCRYFIDNLMMLHDKNTYLINCLPYIMNNWDCLQYTKQLRLLEYWDCLPITRILSLSSNY